MDKSWIHAGYKGPLSCVTRVDGNGVVGIAVIEKLRTETMTASSEKWRYQNHLRQLGELECNSTPDEHADKIKIKSQPGYATICSSGKVSYFEIAALTNENICQSTSWKVTFSESAVYYYSLNYADTWEMVLK